MSETIYVVCVEDSLGEFLWKKKRSDPEQLIGSLVYSYGMDRWHDDSMMSELLFNLFLDWAKSYLDAAPPNYSFHPDEIYGLDWDKFNDRGCELAQRLQVELGQSALVEYRKASNDPTR